MFLNKNTNNFKKSEASIVTKYLASEFKSLDLPENIKLISPNPSDLTKFNAIIAPEQGSLWFGGEYVFSFDIPANYPFEPPIVKCQTKVFHPNIDFKGNVCLNILKMDWNPTLKINIVLVGLNFLFVTPEANDPLNDEVAELMRNDMKSFEEVVKKTLKGSAYRSHSFPKFI